MFQTKDFGLTIKDVSEAGQFEGYASTFGGDPDSYGDVVMPGAFAKSLERCRSEGAMPLMLFGHKSSELPIGIWLEMTEDAKGLKVKGKLDLGDDVSSRVHRALLAKSIRGLSIGYETKDAVREKGVNYVKEVELYEVSVVNFPANRQSLVTGVKSATKDLRDRLAAGDRLQLREMERLLRDQLELSNSEAERAVRLHFKNGQGEPDGTADERVAFLRELVSPSA